MTALSAIFGLLSSLPQLLSLGQKLWAYLIKVSGGDVAGYLLKSNEAFGKLDKAKTDQEYADAAKAIRDLIRNS